MPYVNVKITKDGVTKSQKQQIVRDNWGFTGMLTTEYRKKSQ